MCCRASIPLIVTCVTLAIVSAGTAEGQSCPVITDPQPLNTNADSDSGLDRYPQLTTDGAGIWVAVWESHENLGGTIGIDFDILIAASTDNGVTWTDPAPLNTNADSDSDDDTRAQVTTDGQGNWVAVWQSRDDLGGSIGTDGDILVSVSTNNGGTWTTPVPLNTNAAGDSGSDRAPQVTTDGAGNWVASWYSWDDLGGTLGTDTDILFALSTDNGANWTDPAPLNTNAAFDSGSDRAPQVTTDGQGNWVAVWGSADDLGGTIGTDADILYARSTNNGVAWTDPAPLNTNAAFDSGVDGGSQVTTDGQGQWLAVWVSADDLHGHIGTDLDILYSRSTNNGAAWTYPAPLNTNAPSDFDKTANDYAPQLTTDGAGHWVAVWTLVVGWDDPDIMFSLSTNNGSTWSGPAALNSHADSDSGFDYDWEPQLSTDGAGNWVAVWSSSYDLGGTIGSDLDILAARLQLIPGECVCPADLDKDGSVGAGDLAQLLGAWGPNPDHPADFNGDGVVDAADLAQLLGSWGPCP